MAISDRLNKLTTDITNAYTSIENKGGTIPSDKNTDNLHTAIDSIQSSNIIGATAEGESLSLTNTKAMPYNDYVVKGKSEQDGEPSPSIPSEIHSVADDVNLFDASKIANSSIVVKDNGKTIIMPLVTSGNGNTNTSTKLNVLCPDLQVGDVIYIRFKRNLNNNRNKFIYLYGSNRVLYASENSPSYTITQEDLNSYVFLYGNDYDYGETQQIIITDFKIQKNKTTPYSPYNQGTVTIKQRGKNLFNIENYSKSGYNVTIANPLKGLSTGYYTISCQNTADVGLAIIFSNEINGSMIGEYFTGFNFGKTLTNKTTSLTQEQLDANYLIMQGSNASITEELLENMQIQIEEGSTPTSYEPYQANDFTFQTAPLRSLPNGVRDSLEDDGIHRRVGRVVLDGSENWELWSGGTNTIGFKLSNITNLKSIQSSSTENIVLSNYFKKKTNQDRLTGEDEEGFATAAGNLYFKINRTTLNSLADWKTWMSTHNTEVLYELATEVIEPLTQNQATTMLDIIKTGSYEGTTNIYTDEDVKPTMKVDYYKYGETGGLPTVENEKLIFDKELQIDREELIF